MALEREELDFRSSVEGLFVQALGPRMTPRLKERLKAEGLDLDAPLAPAYPRRVFSRCCQAAVEELYPGLPRQEGLHRLGRDLVDGYTRTAIGRALAKLLGVFGIERALGQLTRVFRSGDNYTESRMTRVGERRAEVWVSQVNGQAEFTVGALERGLELVGARGLSVRVARLEGEGCVIGVEWGGEAPAEGRAG
jgi:uncharacterized protein (TIGR02265 family)